NPLGSTGAPTGTVFNTDGGALGGFEVSGVDKNGNAITAPAIFLFATEDGTLVGWNPAVNPKGFDPNKAGTYGIIAVDNSGNNFTNPNPNQETGAVYKGLTIATSATPIIASDPNSTALLYASNFRAGTIDVYDAAFHKVTSLPAGAFTDPNLPKGYAPFNVQVLNNQLYVTYAKQDAARHDDVAGPGNGFVDVFNLDGSPGLANGKVRLVSRGALDSPWGLAIAPTGFAGIKAPNGDPVLLVGNFGNGRINAFDATTGASLGELTDPDGEPIQVDRLWALKVGNGGAGGDANTVYFTAGLFGETHGLFGSLTTATPGSPEGAAEAQMIQADLDVVQLNLQTLQMDLKASAPPTTIRQDVQNLDQSLKQLARDEARFTADAFADRGIGHGHDAAVGGFDLTALDNVFAGLGNHAP
ncbi:MAG TPA: TIGR03118 family protein, partial [Pirellulales bacterium]|nr:TIGR03118 family protein [Pirellulales bacterium]